MADLGTRTKDWVFCYPYGRHSLQLVQTCIDYGAALGITTEPRVANLATDNHMLLPRLDTNDLPNSI